MILPEDTKAPLSSDDENDSSNLSFFSAENSPNLVRQGYEGPYSDHPRAAAIRPLLAQEDAEFGPAPAYTAEDENKHQGQYRKADGIRSSRRRLSIALVGAFLVFISMTGFREFGRRRPRLSDGPWRNGPSAPHRPGDLPNTPGNQGHEDGVPVKCAVFNSDTPWSTFPLSPNRPKLPRPLSPEHGYRRSTNLTFFLPTRTEHETFAHLAGPGAVGNVFFSTYQTPAHLPSGSIIGMTGQGKQQDGDQYVKIIVEPIYEVLPAVGSNEAATAENSPGWEWLLASQVCLMDHRTEGMIEVPESGDLIQSVSGGTGVGVYTSRPDSVHHNVSNLPLQFRLHVFLPTLDEATDLTTHEVTGHEFGSHDRPPPNFVRSLAFRGSVGGIYLSDLRPAQLGGLALHTSVGEIIIGKVRAEVIKMTSSTGDVKGDVAVSDALEVSTSV